jgi:uncharacterized membrane protein (UPF0127 family)
MYQNERMAVRSLWALLAGLAALGGCSGSTTGDAANKNNLAAMSKTNVRIGGTTFEVWLARTSEEQQRGLMQVTEDQLAAFDDPAGADRPQIQRGMLFVFDYEQPLAFWMYNTITALDIAYIATDGRIVKTYTMAPLETRTYPSIEPALYALEVRAGLFAELGVEAGQYVEIPESVLKGPS